MAAELTPMVLTHIQHDYMQKFTMAFSVVDQYATTLFYIIAAIEIVLFGVAWAMKAEEAIGAFMMKIFKLGVIFFVISMYPHIIQSLIDGFTMVALHTTSIQTAGYLFNPGTIWKFGFDAGVQMMQLSVQYGTANVGMSNIYLILGFGSLLLFALIGAQIVLTVVAFYVVSLLALLLIPLGTFSGAKNLFERALTSVLRAGARVFALILVVGIAVAFWQQMDLGTISQSTVLTKPLSFFFSTLVFWVLAVKLPPIAVSTVGELGGTIFDSFHGSNNVTVTMPPATVSTQSAAPTASVNSLASATSMNAIATMSAAAVNVSAGSPGTSAGATQAHTNVNVSASMGSAAGNLNRAGNNRDKNMADSGISRETLDKLKSTFKPNE